MGNSAKTDKENNPVPGLVRILIKSGSARAPPARAPTRAPNHVMQYVFRYVT